jgi:hypothetical protein
VAHCYFLAIQVLFEAVDKLPTAVVAVMVLFTVVNVTVFLVSGGLAPETTSRMTIVYG